MIRTTLANAHIKRSLRPIYWYTQATPKSCFLDPAWDRSIAIYPGMVACRNGADQVTLANTGETPYGLFGNFIGGNGIDELLDAGVNACAVWLLNADAEFEVDAPAFDDDVAWTDPTNGTELKVHYWETGVDIGKLAPAGASKASHTLSGTPVARLLKVNSASTITIGGLAVRS